MNNYAPHLGFFRHFALVRRLYDDLQAAKDQLKVQKVDFGNRDREKDAIIARLQDELLRKNNVRPVFEPPRSLKVPSSDTEPQRSHTPLGILDERQNDLDKTAAALNRLHKAAEEAAFREEAEKILTS